MTTPQAQMKYFATAAVIVLVLLVLEALFINTLVSPPPDPFTASILPGLRTLYTFLIILLPLGIVGVIVWVWYALMHRHGSATYGTAHFATKQELRQAGMKKQTTTGDFHQEQEAIFVLGTSHQMEIALSQEQQEGHLLVIAPTKRGKTAGIILPNLLNEQGNRSLFVNDVKHELIDLTIGAVAQRHDCYIISPTRPNESNGYNPLSHVQPEVLSDARNLAECIVRNTGSSKEPFWDNSARLLITAVILHLRTAEPGAAFSRLADICTKSLSEISDIITHSPSSLTQRVGSSFLKNVSNEPKLQSNIMTDIATRLFDMLDPAIEEMTAYNELDFRQLGEQPSALFLHIPPHEAGRLRWLSSCLIMQLINYLFENPHKHKFAFYLDELANAGYIPKYLDYISYIRSAGVSFLQVIQDFGQLERTYEEDGKDTILANSGTKVFLSGAGQVEAEYASRVMGDTTVHSESRSESEGKGTVSYTETGRKLMHPDEVRSLPMWTLLVLIGNIPPIIAKNVPYFQVPFLHARANLPYDRPKRELLPTPLNEPTITSLSAPPTQPPAPKQPPMQPRDDEEYFTEIDMN